MNDKRALMEDFIASEYVSDLLQTIVELRQRITELENANRQPNPVQDKEGVEE